MEKVCVLEILFVVTILHVSVEFSHAHNQAFIQIDNELRYLVDGVAVHMYESISEDGTPSRASSDSSKQPAIRFEPSMLDFKSHALGMPHAERVTIHNPSAEHTISMLSISGSTVHFHCTFFQEKLIPPLGNTSLDVVFLGREVGPVESYLYIHSSVGSFRFQVKAEGKPNPYRLKPLVGVKMPLNSSYAPLIEMYNPHRTSLQVLEMYSSGGDLHLELPSGDVEGQRSQWEVPPYHSRPVMRANFVARQENNHTAFIRIKMNSTRAEDDFLVVPVEVEVTAEPGLFCPLLPVDFGLVAAGSQPRVVRLPLINAAQKHIQIQHVVTSPANDAIEIEFEPLKLSPSSGRATHVAKLTFYPDRVKSEKQLSGKLFIKSKSGQHKIQVPYTAELVGGTLVHDAAQLQFRVGSEALEAASASTAGEAGEVRPVLITNLLHAPLAVYNVSLTLPARDYFTVWWDGARVLQRNESAELVTLTLRPAAGAEPRLSAHLVLHTNVTEFRLPISCYTGKLRTYIPSPEEGGAEADVLDFGTLGVGESRHMYFYLLNENPVPVQLQAWGSNLSGSLVELAGTERGGPAQIRRRTAHTYANKHLLLKPGHYAAVRVAIASAAREGLFVATSFVHTEYEQKTVTFRLRVASGSLTTHPTVVAFDKAFPGKTSYQSLSVHSTFSHPMTLTGLRPEPADSRLEHVRPAEPSTGGAAVPQLVLQPHTNTSIGRLLFRPAAGCADDCYTGFQLTSKRGAKWLQGLALPATIGDVDSALFHAQYTKYLVAAAAGGGDWHNLSLRLDTSEVRGHRLRAQAHLTWPQLVSRRRLRFGVTQVGNVSLRELTVDNPSDHPLAVHLSLLSDYPATQATMDITRQLLGEAPGGGQRSSRSPLPSSFTLLEAGRAEWWPDQEQPLHPDTVAAVLPPGGRLLVPLVFLPSVEAAASDVLIIRNNLTVLDMLLVQGRGAHGQLKFGNQRPGSSSPLLFELSEKHLKDCSRKTGKYLVPNFTVKRAFTTRNVGDVPISIYNFSIDDLPCQGYGFRVLNCSPFQLQPNSSRKVEVAFTPDFTLSLVRRSLRLQTSLPELLVYPLLASLPAQMLLHCEKAIPRPDWEPLFYCVAVTFMIFILFSVLAAAFFESDRILKDTFDLRPPSAMLRSFQQRPRVFDLRRIGDPTISLASPPGPILNHSAENGTPPPLQAVRKSPGTKPEPAEKPNPAAAAASSTTKPTTPPGAGRVKRDDLATPAARTKPKHEKPSVEESEVVMRRRQKRKEAKSQPSWASTIMQSLGMNAAAPTVTEDVRAGSIGRTPSGNSVNDGGQKKSDNNDDADSVTSSTDISTVDDEASTKTDRERGNNSTVPVQSSNGKSVEKMEQQPAKLAFTVTESGSKQQKPVKKSKVKVSSSLPNVGSLELPYKPKTLTDEKKDKKKPRTKATAPVAAVAAGVHSAGWSPAAQLAPQPSAAGGAQAATPQSPWDPPGAAAAAADALGLLSQQTETFARATGLPAPRSSFASVVSGQGDGRRTRQPAVGRVAPERHQPAAGLGPIAPPQRSGAAPPPLLPPPLLPPGDAAGRATWAPTAGAAPAELPPMPLPPTAVPLSVKPPVACDEPSSFGLHTLLTWSTQTPPPVPSLMQSLQADRRAKVQQYEQERQQRATDAINEWPGFGGGAGGVDFGAASIWNASHLWETDSSWSPAAADPARPAYQPADPWAPTAAAAGDSGWPANFAAGDEKKNSAN